MENFRQFVITTIFAFELFAVTGHAQAPAAPAAPAKKSTATENRKLLLANQLIVGMGLDKEAETIVTSTATIFSRVPKAKQPQNQPKMEKIYAEAKLEYAKQKEKIKEDLVSNLKQLLASNFSESELEYLGKISKYPPYEKYRNLSSSDQFGKLLFAPNAKAAQILRDIEQKNATAADTKQK